MYRICTLWLSPFRVCVFVWKQITNFYFDSNWCDDRVTYSLPEHRPTDTHTHSAPSYVLLKTRVSRSHLISFCHDCFLCSFWRFLSHSFGYRRLPMLCFNVKLCRCNKNKYGTQRSLTHCDIVCQWSSSSRSSCCCRRCRHAHGSCIMYCLPMKAKHRRRRRR